MADKAIEVLLQERRNFPPPKALKKSAYVRSEQVFAAALMRDLTDFAMFDDVYVRRPRVRT